MEIDAVGAARINSRDCVLNFEHTTTQFNTWGSKGGMRRSFGNSAAESTDPLNCLTSLSAEWKQEVAAGVAWE